MDKRKFDWKFKGGKVPRNGHCRESNPTPQGWCGEGQERAAILTTRPPGTPDASASEADLIRGRVGQGAAHWPRLDHVVCRPRACQGHLGTGAGRGAVRGGIDT